MARDTKTINLRTADWELLDELRAKAGESIGVDLSLPQFIILAARKYGDQEEPEL